jgi:hypothetical protein
MRAYISKKGEATVIEAAVPLLSGWQNFYVIIGSAAAALTGLMFVVITLIAGTPAIRSEEAVGAFGTPTVFHFGAALLIAAILSAPWPALWNADLLLGLCGFAGMIYIIIAIRRTYRQTHYQPVLEDWLWYMIFPLVSYSAFVVSAIVLLVNAAPALFVIAAGTLLLLFIGIHNSWDTVLYISIERAEPEDKNQDK